MPIKYKSCFMCADILVRRLIYYCLRQTLFQGSAFIAQILYLQVTYPRRKDNFHLKGFFLCVSNCSSRGQCLI